jgi:hypothetical protein
MTLEEKSHPNGVRVVRTDRTNHLWCHFQGTSRLNTQPRVETLGYDV